MTNFSYDKMIAKAIVSAQTASESGKSYVTDYLSGHDGRIALKGYVTKVLFIKRALDLCNGRASSFRYYMTGQTGDQNGHASYITYFSFYDDEGRRRQVSFHTPASLVKPIRRWIGKGTKMRWDRYIGGSSESCYVLSRMYNL